MAIRELRPASTEHVEEHSDRSAAKSLHHEPWVWLPFPENHAGSPEERLAGVSTHLSLWPAASSLLRWLEPQQDALGLTRLGTRILELGSGTGWLGMTLAKHLPNASITLTERPEGMCQLQEACARFSKIAGGPSRLQAEQLDWRDYLPHHEKLGPLSFLHREEFDVVLGSDLIWSYETAESYPSVVRALLDMPNGNPARKCPLVLYGHWRRSPKWHDIFLERCREVGLVATLMPSVEKQDVSAVDHTAEVVTSLEAESTDDSEVDFMSLIFDDESSVHKQQVFFLYQLTLAA
eukprot:TRINITY_DN44307_c0_g1_i1.p1 TRINITY_DN44307_c0_g1~~TRINITY_DN44307_c0_g1_i1.p1  ORF type:complete len:307 (+),score=33.91 TRINITY_DN44307_c0_g1_i1:43-921(+)